MRPFILLLTALAISTTQLSAWSIPGLSKSKETAKQAEEAVPETTEAINKALQDSITSAKNSVGGNNPELSALLSNIQKQADGGDNLALVQSLSGLGDIPNGQMLTSTQQELLGEVKGHAQALALKRQFSDDPSLEGPVTDAVKAVQSKDTTAAVASLQSIAEKGTLSSSQQQLLKAMLGDYGTYLDSASKAADTVNSLKSLF